MLRKFQVNKCKPALIPIAANFQDEEEGGKLPTGSEGKEMANITNFQSLAGSLLWIMRCTSPDLAFAIHAMTRKTHAPTKGDWRIGI